MGRILVGKFNAMKSKWSIVLPRDRRCLPPQLDVERVSIWAQFLRESSVLRYTVGRYGCSTTLNRSEISCAICYLISHCVVCFYYCATHMCIARFCCGKVSVCLSHAGIVSKRIKISSKVFSRPCSPTTMVF